MKLVDLHPELVGTSNGRTGTALKCDCPCGKCDDPLFVHFANPLDGGPPVHKVAWQRTGDDFTSMSLSPSIRRIGGCEWHGYLRNGAFESC